MNAPNALGHAALAAIEVRERRRRRSAIAARLLASGADAMSAIDWEMLEAAPAWLALPDAKLATLQRQIGALLYAPEIRLWIDGARLNAARTVLGETFLKTLLAQRDLHAFPQDTGTRPRIDTADHVPTHLQVAGASVLLASIQQGPLRRAVAAAMAPTAAMAMACEMAQALVTRAQSLVTQGSSSSPLSTSPGSVA
ncbi:MAG TPA: hypothetical protein VLW55_07185 [Burkholderiaceae bacterium]|nr:hypothetical protein [Burkholderiaceae bacterium]